MAYKWNVTEISCYPAMAVMCKNVSLQMLGVKIIATFPFNISSDFDQHNLYYY
jgi:hypothetical protein